MRAPELTEADLLAILVTLVALGALQVADQEHPHASLLHKGSELGHGHVDELALVVRLIARHQDREVIQDDPAHLLGHGHEAAVAEDCLWVNRSEAVTQEDPAGAQGLVKGGLELLLRNLVVEVEGPVGLD